MTGTTIRPTYRLVDFCTNIIYYYYYIIIIITPVRLYMTEDRFDNFPLMADKIQVKSTDKGFVVQSKSNKTRELVRQVILFEPKGFHVGNLVSVDFFRVHGFRNISVTTCSTWPQAKLFANDLQVITLADHSDVISCFICWYKHIFLICFTCCI